MLLNRMGLGLLIKCVPLLALPLVFAWACADTAGDSGRAVRERAEARGPRIVPVDPILLEESDQFYIGRPHAMVVDTIDRSFLVGDSFENRILRFAWDGRLIQTYGRPGEGPGEFRAVSSPFVVDDTIVVGFDTGQRLESFSRRDGKHLESGRYPGITPGPSGSVVGRTVVVSVVRDEIRTFVGVWDRDRNHWDNILTLPLPYRRSMASSTRALLGIFGVGSVTAWADTMLAGMAATNELYLATLEGEVLDTLGLPRALRRGVPENAHDRIDNDMSIDFRERVEMLSTLHGLYRMTDGSTAVIHHDIELKGEPPGPVEFLADVYVSILSSDRTRACADGAVPFTNEMRAAHTVSQDTLYLLDRTLNAAEDGMETWIRRYVIDTSACDWLPVE